MQTSGTSIIVNGEYVPGYVPKTKEQIRADEKARAAERAESRRGLMDLGEKLNVILFGHRFSRFHGFHYWYRLHPEIFDGMGRYCVMTYDHFGAVEIPQPTPSSINMSYYRPKPAEGHVFQQLEYQ